MHVDGEILCFVDRGRFRLYLGDSCCICFYRLYMLGGDIMVLPLLLFLVSHMLN